MPMYQRVGQKAYKIDLSNIQKLSAHLGDPHSRFKTVHVAGTNGKGSVSHMLASILQESGYKVGLYTSPHLKDFRERIKINGKEIPEEAVVTFMANHQGFFEEEKLSFFEMTVGLAFDHFAKEEVDIAIIEVGLGGRLDSTNIITPELSVITNIGYDHTQVLGNTLAEIAAEKGGIIKREVPVVIGESHQETLPVFVDKAFAQHAPLHMAENGAYKEYSSDLKGFYQKKNIRTVLKSIEVLRGREWFISEAAVIEGLKKVIPNTGLRGRWEVIRENPKVICDTAHNKEGLSYSMNQLQEEEGQIHFVFGVVSDKDLSQILPLLPKTAKYYFCRPAIPRGMDAEKLREQAMEFRLTGKSYNSVPMAYEAALAEALDNDVIYVGGSTFTVAEII